MSSTIHSMGCIVLRYYISRNIMEE